MNKTVAERLREIANGKRQYPGCELLVSVATGSARCRQDANTCTECKGKNLKDLADMIEAEQAELRAENERLRRDFYEPCARMGFTEHAHGIEVVFDAMSRAAQGHECRVDFKALDLLCDKLECGDANHRATAAQIRKAMSGAERPHEVNREVDVDALLKLADHLNERTSYDPKGDNLLADTIRNAVKGAKPQLPEGIEWPRFTDGELVKFGDEFVNEFGDLKEANIFTFFEDGCSIGCESDFKYGEPLKRPKPDTFESVVGEMMAEWDASEGGIVMDGYFARFRKLMGGE